MPGNNLPYRENVQMWIFDESGKICFLDARKKSNYFKFPQGGVEKGEDLESAVRRELKEELNIVNFEVVAKAKYEHYYDWDEKRQKERGFRGQHQSIFLVRLLPGNKVQKMDDEFDAFMWVYFSELMPLITIPNQIEMTKKLWLEFEPIIRDYTNFE